MPKRALVLDEWVDRVFSRPLARVIVAVAARTPITPNGLTLISGSCGVFAGVCIAMGFGLAAAVGVLLFLIFDCSDGQLARRRGGGGVYGRAFDGVGDYLSAVSIHLGLGIGLGRTLPWWEAAGLAIGAGFALWWASFLLDRYKRRYGQKRDDLDEVRREIAGSKGFKRFVLQRFLTYAEQLEADDVEIPDLDAYQARTRGPMLWFLLNGPTMHYFVMAGFFAFGLARLYCFVAIASVGITIATHIWQRIAERGVVGEF